jgi:hypothetical protein
LEGARAAGTELTNGSGVSCTRVSGASPALSFYMKTTLNHISIVALDMLICAW